jgi:hypothetical protein
LTRPQVTLIQTRRRDGDVIAAVCAITFALAAWRGASGAPVLAAVMGVLALGTITAWAAWRRAPPMQLTITAEELTLGSAARVINRIPRSAAPVALRHTAARQAGWFLVPRGDSGLSGISLIGFDPATVRDACLDHGWDIQGM